MSITSKAQRSGIFLVMAAIILVSCSDAIAKLMTARMPVMQIALVQSVVLILAVPMMLRRWRILPLLATRQPGLQLTRSLCHLGSALSFFTGLKYLPLADMIAIIFIGPLLITVLAAIALGEAVGARRWGACAVGFVGALIVVRPGFGGIGWTAIYPLAATILYAIYVICTRKLAPTESTGAMMFYSAVATVVILGAASPWYWAAPVGISWLALGSIGLLSGLSTMLAIKAYSLAEASLLAPYTYVEIVSATALGFLIFGDLPDAYTVLGATIIVASGAYIYRHDKR